MANFIKLSEELRMKIKVLSAFPLYYVEGKITLDDVKKLNENNEPKILILKNTVNQDSDIIKQIDKSKTKFSVLGGLDYLKIKKYNETKYIKRTIYSPLVLSEVISKLKKLEKGINDNWSNTEKSLYIYKKIVEECHYQYDDENAREKIDDNDYEVIRNLTGILYKRFVCAGFALTYKEIMDRIGVPCFYQSRQNSHAWNILKLEDKYVGVDLTWDCDNKKGNHCSFIYFGLDKNFYSHKSHNITNEPEEIKFNLTTLSEENIVAKILKINENKIEIYKMRTITNKIGENINYYKIESLNNMDKYYFELDGEIKIIYIEKNIPLEIITISDIKAATKNGGFIGIQSQITSDYRTYRRDDGTSFIISDKKKIDNNINQYYYMEFTQTENAQIIKYIIASETELLNPNENETEAIANALLERKRLKQKMENFRGYVGSLDEHNALIYDADYESKLNGRR